jgi:predicted transcriptional regulator
MEILSVIWKNGPSSVRQVNDKLIKDKKVGYTTTLKLMQIMTEKGLLTREEHGRLHIYRAAVREEETKEILLDRFLATTFGGSAMQLVMQALGRHKATPEDLRELKKLIKKLEEDQE